MEASVNFGNFVRKLFRTEAYNVDNRDGMEHEFGHMVYHEWQRRLLVASSCCFLLVAGVAHLSFAKTELACVMSVVGAASLNYWRAPGPSWRRPIDLGCAAFGMSYNSVHGWFVVQNSWANAIGWTAHTLGPRPRELCRICTLAKR